MKTDNNPQYFICLQNDNRISYCFQCCLYFTYIINDKGNNIRCPLCNCFITRNLYVDCPKFLTSEKNFLNKNINKKCNTSVAFIQ